MLMRRARAYSSSCSQVVLVYVHPFHCRLLFCSQKSQKNYESPLFWGSKSFKVIDVNTAKKHVTRACYDKQHVCVYLQPFSCWTSQYRKNNHFLTFMCAVLIECRGL